MKRWVLGIALTVGLTAASWATDSTANSPDPVRDCPRNLVCYTLAEEAASQKAAEAVERERDSLRTALRKQKFGRYFSGGVSRQTDGYLGFYSEVGFYVGPFGAGAGISEYGTGPHGYLTAHYTRTW